jgi:hypothetical protein
MDWGAVLLFPSKYTTEIIQRVIRLLDENITFGYISAALLLPVLLQSICTPLQFLKSPARYWGSNPSLIYQKVLFLLQVSAGGPTNYTYTHVVPV